MGIIVLLISISVTIALAFLAVFYWNIKSGQYDDTYTPSVRILFEDKNETRPDIDKTHNREENTRKQEQGSATLSDTPSTLGQYVSSK